MQLTAIVSFVTAVLPVFAALTAASTNNSTVHNVTGAWHKFPDYTNFTEHKFAASTKAFTDDSGIDWPHWVKEKVAKIELVNQIITQEVQEMMYRVIAELGESEAYTCDETADNLLCANYPNENESEHPTLAEEAICLILDHYIQINEDICVSLTLVIDIVDITLTYLGNTVQGKILLDMLQTLIESYLIEAASAFNDDVRIFLSALYPLFQIYRYLYGSQYAILILC